MKAEQTDSCWIKDGVKAESAVKMWLSRGSFFWEGILLPSCILLWKSCTHCQPISSSPHGPCSVQSSNICQQTAFCQTVAGLALSGMASGFMNLASSSLTRATISTCSSCTMGFSCCSFFQILWKFGSTPPNIITIVMQLPEALGKHQMALCCQLQQHTPSMLLTTTISTTILRYVGSRAQVGLN